MGNLMPEHAALTTPETLTREEMRCSAAAPHSSGMAMDEKRRMRSASMSALSFLLLFLLILPSHGQQVGMVKLIGGSITWTVNPDFLGGASNRTVTFNMRTSWALGNLAVATPPDCEEVQRNTDVKCNIQGLQGSASDKCNPGLTGTLHTDACGVAERFGVLCVAQLVRTSIGGVIQLQAKFSDPNAQCVHEANVHLSRTWTGSTYDAAADKQPKVRVQAGDTIKVGIPNKFRVQQVYDSPVSTTKKPSSVGRKPGPSVVVTGTISHTVLIEEDVSQVVAWLAPRTGFKNYESKTGLLLQECSATNLQATTPCMFNECMLQRLLEPGVVFLKSYKLLHATEYKGAAFRPAHPTTGQQFADNYWDTWDASGCGSGKSCLKRASPALETYLHLCSNDINSLRKCTDGIDNYYSPVSSLPDLIEVAVTPASSLGPGAQFNYFTGTKSTNTDRADAGSPDVPSNAPWTYKGYNPSNPSQTQVYEAPHGAFRVHSYDYDGQQMTQYSPQFANELKGSKPKMGAGDIDWVSGRDPQPALAVRTNCLGTDVCCTAPPIRSMRVDCVEGPPNPTGSNPWPGVTEATPGPPGTTQIGGGTESVTGCRFFYDFDRDVRRSQGNLIKPDFSFSNQVLGATASCGWTNCKRSLDTDPCGSPQSTCNRFTQHVLNTVDFPFYDVDNPAGNTNHISNNKVNWKGPDGLKVGQSIIQNVFSMFPCNAGTENQPPVFVQGLCQQGAAFSIDKINSCSDSTNINPTTTYECKFWEACVINLYARDFTMINRVDGRTKTPTETPPKNPVDIQYAIGYDHLPTADIEAAGPTCCSDGAAHFKYFFRPVDLMDPTTGFMDPIKSIGQIFVRCFVAYDMFSTEIVSTTQRSCPSMPLCIKIRITGSLPTFIAPTPLGDSFDDNGILVPNRHDYASCQGFPMVLDLKVTHSIPESVVAALRGTNQGLAYLQSLKFRIFIEDKDVDFDINTNMKSSYKYLAPGGKGNMDFFEPNNLKQVDLATQTKCGEFAGFGAKRMGNNDMQTDPVPMVGQGNAKSVMSDYQKNIEYCRCTDDPCDKCNPADPQIPRGEIFSQVRVEFISDTAKGLGVSQRKVCKEINLENGLEYELANCREKLMNMDQVICAVAFDNARSVFKRWVGERDPNGKDINRWLRDHSNGDHASAQQCFRIKNAAPPVFVTDPTGSITPFSDQWSRIIDTTDDPDAYKTITFRVGQRRELIFVAQDPNPSDFVEIFILADPGIPRGMRVGLSECIIRDGDNSMCKADDQIDKGKYFITDWSATFSFDTSSRCSRAKRRVEWVPDGTAAGKTFKICAVARDDSSECSGKGSEFATPRGWFGEQQCVIINVLRLQIVFGGDFANMGTGNWTMKAYVGCEFKFRVDVKDALQKPDDPNDFYPLTIMMEEAGLEGVRVASGGVVSRPSLNANWVPPRGTEGKSLLMCFAVRDKMDILKEPMQKLCRGGGSEHLKGCYSDSECGGGICQKACVKMDVQRCQYCLKSSDTLAWMTRYFGIETNWMRLWALNSYQMNSLQTQEVQGAIFPSADPPWILSDGSSRKAYITDPDALTTTAGVQRVYVGAVYRASVDDKLIELAARFRTTVKALMAMNPDVESDTQLSSGDQRLCILPCTLSRT